MARVVLVLPDLLVPDRDDSPLRQNLPALTALGELGTMLRLAAVPPVETPEAVWLGMEPSQAQLRQGPLTISALGADPPARSTHFHLSLLGLVEGRVVLPPPKVDPGDLRVILSAAKRLNTKTLTLVEGDHLDHGLVWEGLGDLRTCRPEELLDNELGPQFPQGDADTLLRRFIDDSVNILSELELNERRLDEGIAPLNLLWPSGHGVRMPVPNLALRRGEPAVVESGSMRLAGLTRLAGYKHVDRSLFGTGLGIRLDEIASRCIQRALSFVVIQTPAELRSQSKLEEEHWFLKQLDDRLLQPLLSELLQGRLSILIAAPGSQPGLALTVRPKVSAQNSYPFDERSLEERGLRTADAWTLIESASLPVEVGQTSN